MEQGLGTQRPRELKQETSAADLNQLRQPPTLPGNEALKIFIEEIEQLNPNSISSQFASNPRQLEKDTPHSLVFGVKGAKDRFLLQFQDESAMKSFQKKYSHRQKVAQDTTPRTFLLNRAPIKGY
jgi:hypothetical protein